MRGLVFSIFLVMALSLACAPHAASTEPAGEGLTLKTADGVTFRNYRTGPSGARHGILLIPDGWGLTDAVRRWADHLGAAGYRVLALDLYGGKQADSAGRAQEYAAALNQAVVDTKYRAALQSLAAPGRKMIAMGGGFGGAQALHAALVEPYRVAAVVIYDGPLNIEAADVRRLQAPVLGVFDRQGGVPLDSIKAFETAMKRANKRVRIYFYDGKTQPAGPTEEYFSGEPGETLWRQTQAFLQLYLK